MRRPDDAVRELALEWLGKAEIDPRAGAALFTAGDLCEPVAFHAQQAVEKALKAFLVWHQLEFAKTHDISLLLDLCATLDSNLADELAGSEELTPYGVDYRYPGEHRAVSRADAETSLQAASAAVLQVTKRLTEGSGA